MFVHRFAVAAAAASFFGAVEATLPLVSDMSEKLGLDHISTGVTQSLDLDLAPVVFGLDKNVQDEILFEGICQAKSETSAAVHLGLNLHEAHVSGDVKLSVEDEFLLHPTVKLCLADIKAYIEVDLDASAAVHESVELLASPQLELNLGKLLEAELDVAFALDLVLSVNAAVKLSAGFYVEFGADAYVEINLITQTIVDVNLEGLVATATQVGTCTEIESEIELSLGLRLRTQIGIEAGCEIPGLDLVAEGQVDIWLNLFEYTAVLLTTNGCTLSVREAFALSIGIAVDLDVHGLDILDINLAPEAFIKLAAGPIDAQVCLPGLGDAGSYLQCPSTTTASSTTALVTSTTSTRVTSSTTSSKPITDASTSHSVPVYNNMTMTTSCTESVVMPTTSTTCTEEESTAVTSYSAPTTTCTEEESTAAVTSYSATTTTCTEEEMSTPAVTSYTAPTVSVSTEEMVTSTCTVSKTYTITSCAASVHNCPATWTQKVVTSTVYESTTVCPATMTGTQPAYTTAAPTMPTMTHSLTTIVPCSPTTSHFSPPPTNVPPPQPTVTVIEDQTTVCPSTAAPPATYATSVAVSPTEVAPTSMYTPPMVTGNCPGCPPAGGNGPTWTSIYVAPTATGTGVMPNPTGSYPQPTNTMVQVAGASQVELSFLALMVPAVFAALL